MGGTHLVESLAIRSHEVRRLGRIRLVVDVPSIAISVPLKGRREVVELQGRGWKGNGRQVSGGSRTRRGELTVIFMRPNPPAVRAYRCARGLMRGRRRKDVVAAALD